jgi:hypothetical protein
MPRELTPEQQLAREKRIDRAVTAIGQADQLAPSAPRDDYPAPPAGAAWNEHGELEEVTLFEYPEAPRQDDGEDSLVAHTRKETVKALLGFLALGETNLKKIGWRAALFCYLHFPNQSQADLAKNLGVSPSSLSEKLNAAKAELAAFLRAN